MDPEQEYKIAVGVEESAAERQRLTGELEQRLIVAGLPAQAISREAEHPGQTMAAGTILTFKAAKESLHLLLGAVRSWLASRRTEIEIQTPDGRKIKISAANFEEARRLLSQAKKA